MNLCPINITSLTKLVLWVSVGFFIGFGYREVLQHLAKDTPKAAVHNINKAGRTQRAIIAVGLFGGALLLNCNPVMLIASGFTLFEVAGSWCVMNAMLGKNSCDLE